MALRWIQRYFCKSEKCPPCEYIEQCRSRAIGMWVDEEGHCHDLCLRHSQSLHAPAMTEGYYYAPLNL